MSEGFYSGNRNRRGRDDSRRPIEIGSRKTTRDFDGNAYRGSGGRCSIGTFSFGWDPRVPTTISSLIFSTERGDRSAADALFAMLYSELHRLAKRELARHGSGVTLSATTLLHEAYLDISGREGTVFPDEGRFMAYAAKVMRGLIIDYARNRQAQKRGGGFEITSLGDDVGDAAVDETELVRISTALDSLASVDAPLAEVVDLKFFCGFSFVEIAAMRGVSERTVQRHWEKARIYLHRSIRNETLA
jgi:RNA polymerase sigma factor (TIGR02999 family)